MAFALSDFNFISKSCIRCNRSCISCSVLCDSLILVESIDLNNYFNNRKNIK